MGSAVPMEMFGGPNTQAFPGRQPTPSGGITSVFPDANTNARGVGSPGFGMQEDAGMIGDAGPPVGEANIGFGNAGPGMIGDAGPPAGIGPPGMAGAPPGIGPSTGTEGNMVVGSAPGPTSSMVPQTPSINQFNTGAQANARPQGGFNPAFLLAALGGGM